MILSLDFETRSEADLRKVGLYRYAEHESTDILCYAVSLDNAAPTVHGPGSLAHKALAHIESGGLVSAWNAQFEYVIWNTVGVRRYGWPPLKVGQMRDTMAYAAAMNLPQALGDCAKLLGLPQDQQKDKRGKYLIQTLCKPRSAGQHKGEFREDPELLEEMRQYCIQDVVVECAIAAKIPALSEYEQGVWEQTLRINERGIPIALDEVTNITRLVEAEKARLNAELYAISNVAAATQRAGVLGYLQGVGLDLPDLTGETVDAALNNKHTPVAARRVLEIRSEVAQTSTAKFDKLLEITSVDGNARGLLVYHGASTGRYASRGGFNAQNLPRPPFKNVEFAHWALSQDHDMAHLMLGDDLMSAAVSCVRGVIKAPEGYEFIDADFSSVENRVAAWIAGQDDKVADFALGKDEYKTFATAMYGVEYVEVTKDMRQVAKSAVLGGMFGQGWKGLIDYATTYGVTLDEEKARHLIDTYRAQYPKVKKLWYTCGDAAIRAVRNPGAIIPAGDKLALTYRGGFLRMKLPSGRIISWYQPTIELLETPWGELRESVVVWTQNPVTRKFSRGKLIGSSIFQSGVQGTARDILVNGVFNVEAAGYQVVMLVHDEALALSRKGEGSPDDLGRLLCTPPAWAETLPLAFEAWTDVRFHK